MQSSSETSRHQALRVLSEASSSLFRARDEEDLLRRILELASRLLIADAYGVWRESEDRLSWRVIAQQGLSDLSPKTLNLGNKTMPPGVWLIEDIHQNGFVEFPKSIDRDGGIRSVMGVPWVVDTVTHGGIIFGWRTAHPTSPEDVDNVIALSNLSASALDRLELNEQNRHERGRLAFLAEASATLGSSLDYESTLERVARLAVSYIAEWCTVHVAENGKLTRLVTAHADPSMAEFALEYERRYPEKILASQGAGKVFSTGVPEIIPVITEEMLAASAIDSEHLRLLRQMRLSSSIVVPLKSRDKVLGAIRLLGTKHRYFGDSDVQLALDLGQRAAVAIENARLHQTLLEQTSELRLSHAAAKMGSWTWDLENDRLTWSAEFKALHGLPEEAVASGEAAAQLIYPEDREQAQRLFRETLESSALTFNSEHRSMASDGRILWLQVRGRIRRDANGKASWIAGLIIDVTESRMAEQALRRAEKLAAAGRLAATVAHEVNNPLEALVNAVYLAQHAADLAEVSRHLQLADSELRRITHIVKQTLGFYRESTLPRSTGLLQLVSEVQDLYRSRSLSRGVTVCTSATTVEEVFVTVIAGEIKQVLANLIANAIDATPSGGIVETSVLRLDDFVEIAVTDTGCGISKENRKRLFEPFFTTKADVGTGLGLWVSQGIVQKHGGSILVEDAEGRGTTFRVRLPDHA
jgi:PAS domain S-box-containing protein